MIVTSRRQWLKQAAWCVGGRGLVGATGLAVTPSCGGSATEEDEAYAPWSYPGDEARIEQLVAGAGLLASSPHNTQPWALTIQSGVVELRARLDRHLGAMDGLRRELYVGLGCAVENMVVAARALGRSANLTLLPAPADEALVARLELGDEVVPDARVLQLLEAIPRRHTHRGGYLDAPPAPGLEPALRGLMDDDAVELHVLQSPEAKASFREATIAATEAIIDDAAMSADSYAWYRHTREEIATHRDGTTLDATGSGALTRTLGKVFAKPDAATADDYWLEATRGRQTTGSAFVVLSSSSANTREEQLRVGRVYQRLHLWATHEGLAMQPLNQLAERQDREETEGLERRAGRVLEAIVTPARRAQMLFRVGYAWDPALPSPRRPLEWVLS